MTENKNQKNFFNDNVCAGELKLQMLRYSRDTESATRTAFDYAIYLFKRLGLAEIASIIESAKAELLADSYDDALKDLDTKSTLQYIIGCCRRAEFYLTALVFENHLVERWGELDDHRFKTRAEKKAVEKAVAEKIVEDVHKNIFNESPTISSTAKVDDTKIN